MTTYFLAWPIIGILTLCAITLLDQTEYEPPAYPAWHGLVAAMVIAAVFGPLMLVGAIASPPHIRKR